jgi:hypothetical protein
MSYNPFSDNPDLASISAGDLIKLEELSEQIDQSSGRGNHRDECGCTDPACAILERNVACKIASGIETLGWLYAKGMFTLPRDTAPKDWTPKIDELVTGQLPVGGPTPIGKYAGQLHKTARIQIPSPDGEPAKYYYVDGDTLRPVDLDPDLVAEAGLTHLDEAARTQAFAAFDAAKPTHRSRTHDITATEWLKHGDHPRIDRLDKQTEADADDCRRCDKPGPDHGWIPNVEETVCPGDWIVLDTDGTIGAFNPETFVSVYEPIKDDGAPNDDWEPRIDQDAQLGDRVVQVTNISGDWISYDNGNGIRTELRTEFSRPAAGTES